ncbi:MAG: M28 family peptidase [Candidatus Vecturithrix sp.]|jgi:aminopeptidase YwaD|nr:M28 family peptidase [Candidatus Vecturithrix sp.]
MSDNHRHLAVLAATIHDYIQKLCVHIPNRHVGSPGNMKATDFFANTIAAFGFETTSPEFSCIDWEYGDVQLQVGEDQFQAFISPYSLSCHCTAPLVEVSTLAELEQIDAAGKILLVHGELAKEQGIPKNYPFEIPVTYPGLLRRFEAKAPAAIIAATSKNPALAGSVYPFPLIEDGDFDLPSVYMTDVEGERLCQYCGTHITLHFDSQRIPARGCNVIARKGSHTDAKLVFCAHIDAKKNTPGALDNASGVAVLLALAELLSDYSGPTVEIVALNGEDYYAASGQALYLATNKTVFDQIQLAINLDGAGYYDGKTSYSLYGCPQPLADHIRQTLIPYSELYEGEAWYQSDHMIFAVNQRPALAITSEKFVQLCTEITHTEKDRPELVDCRKLAVIACGLYDIVQDSGSGIS